MDRRAALGRRLNLDPAGLSHVLPLYDGNRTALERAQIAKRSCERRGGRSGRQVLE